MLTRRNPLISTNTDDAAFVDGEVTNLMEQGFAMAFGLEHFLEGVKNDPRYVKWIGMENI